MLTDVHGGGHNNTGALVRGAAGAGVAVGAVPVVGVAVVQGMGFTASGIAAGSTAAAMMSAEAIAAGGSAAAGGTVATLQTVGAVGMAGAAPAAGIALMSLSAATAVGYGTYLAVDSFTKRPALSTKPSHHAFPFRKFAIRAPNGRYLKALGGGRGNWFFDWQAGPFYTGVIKAEAEVIDNWEMFTVHPLEGDSFALQSHHGAFLCAENGGGTDVIANRHAALAWETFRFTTLEGNEHWAKGYFQAFDGSYMTINHPHAHFTANTRDQEHAAVFEVIQQL